MLTQDIKKKIDSARNILVGKVPDPKAQVEQITTALIYKFMDDMDMRAASLPKGKPQFFANGYGKYAWGKIMDAKLGGQERLNLYVEAIEQMGTNKHLPQLFRDIFKDAFLPYRDPETLNLFLKEINGFEYDHSENLGDAFEYLLSVLGSQGDAGQFRTPRHIIDFVVDVVDPKKDETILDPACGTAGFLISAHKHILKTNKNKPLTPDEKKRLGSNLAGYDISPDMVKLSLVNMYLHGFPSPNIYEYDTLTSDEKWEERFDVMLANPPFMTPKGGVRPHKRFMVDANRTEILFVDYITEHLNSKGRAGIIVPEGIIFTATGAYKSLRKILVEDGLYAVVSLPAGVFNPYSNVKTSILFFDNQLSKQSKEVLFLKVQNDGFDLGAQRKSIDKNDLPQITEILKKHRDSILSGTKNPLLKKYGDMAWDVPKERIIDSGIYNLSGDSYRTNATKSGTEWETVSLKDVCDINPPKSDIKDLDGDTLVSFVPMAHLNEHKMYFAPQETKKLKEVIKGYTYFRDNDVLLAKITPCFENGKAGIAEDLTNSMGFGSTEFYVLRANAKVNPKWLYYCISDEKFRQEGENHMTGSAGQQRLSKSFLSNYSISLPPLDVQEQIIAELDGYQKIIEGAEKIIENYEVSLPLTNSEWTTIGEVCTQVQYGISDKLNTNKKGYKIFRMNELVGGFATDGGEMKHVDISPSEFKKYKLENGDILFNRTNSYEHVGRTGIFNLEEDYCFASYLIRLKVDGTKILPEFLNLYMNSKEFQSAIKLKATRAIGQANINAQSLKQAQIPLPPLSVQQQIVESTKQEQEHIEAAKKIVVLFEQKIRNAITKAQGVVTESEADIQPASDQKTSQEWFAIKLGIGAILERLAQTPYERGEMVIAKLMFLLKEVFGVPFKLSFARHQFGPYDPNIKKAILASAFNKDKFFKVKGSGEKQVYSLGDNASKLLKYDARILQGSREALDDLMSDLSHEKSRNIELLATVCKVIQDIQSTDLNKVETELQGWKPNKFKREEISGTLEYVKHKGWDANLLKR